jgi:hypothetical protein
MSRWHPFLAAVVAAGLLSAAASAATGAFAPRKPCGSITGPRWTFLKGPETGTKYTVVAIGPYGCAAAKKWVAKLVTDKVKNRTSSLVNNNVLSNGPKGYACAAHSSKEGRAFSGACGKGPKLNPTSGFTWSGIP